MKTRTNDEWLPAFEAYLKRRFPKRSTAKHYVSDLRIFMQQHFRSIDRDHTARRGCLCGSAECPWAGHSNDQTAGSRALKTFFDFMAEELGQPDRLNPVSMQRHAGKPTKRLPRGLTDAEVKCFLEAVDNLQDLAMIHLMLYAGRAVGE